MLQIRAADLGDECERELLKHAVSEFLQKKDAVQVTEEPCQDLVKFYATLSNATGLEISRPTAAVALLRALNMEHLNVLAVSRPSAKLLLIQIHVSLMNCKGRSIVSLARCSTRM